ncbi:MAG: thioesterase family protein [Pseudomonadota bacterium]
MSFSKATAVDTGERPYKAEIAAGWDIGGNANGGYLLAIGAKAMAAAAARPHPLSMTAHFLSPGRVGPVSIDPQIVKVGRRLTTVRATMQTEDKPLIELLGSFGDLNELEGPARVDATPPDLPPPEECVRSQPRQDTAAPPQLMSKIDLRLHPEDAKFATGEPTGTPLVRGWVRHIEGEPLDVFGLLLATDCFPPTVFNARLPIAWAPTVELTAHVRGVPEQGWLRCRFSTRFISGGMMEEDGEVWDQSGRLVAQSRQLAFTPKAPS